MDFNPLTEACSKLRAEIDSLHSRLGVATADVNWYRSTNPHWIRNDVLEHEARANEFENSVYQIDMKIIEARGDCQQAESGVRTLFNPKNWFDKNQRNLRRERDEFQDISTALARQRSAEEGRLNDTRKAISALVSTLRKYEQFDIVGRENDLTGLQRMLGTKTGELSHLTDRKNRVDEILQPLVNEMQQLQSKKDAAERQASSARDIERRLSHASNSYERAIAHEECERQFGDGRPRGVIAKFEREARRIENDCDKAVRRAEEVGRKAARAIESLVIDGNNMCYDSQGFIGLSALISLVRSLSDEYSVLVVFDSAIRRMLRVDDPELQSRFGGDAKVHVVASRQLADETILDLASASSLTYVLSNDRFGDFNEKSAVRDGRIIRHEIVSGHVFVHDLQINAFYKE